MDTVYLGFTVFLFALAIFDLMVGVSNDAVNFLNSAIGAKVATFKTIIIVAAAGIFIGASMSNGMMEVARHGVFHPSMFSFREVMFIFLAVMVSDIVLLDVFNTLGMPTSTTVSLVFELFGGAFAMSLIKSWSDPGLNIAEMMNTGKALSMIMAIFISVAVAFFFGTVVQYLSRLLMTFTYKGPALKWKIGIFGGLAATSIIYFMVIKGIGNFSFISRETMAAINSHSWMICGISFLVTDGFISEKLNMIQSAGNSIRRERQDMKQTRRKEILGIRRIDPDVAIGKNTWFHLGRNSCEDILYSLRRICDPCEEHIDNNFVPLPKERVKEFLPVRDTMLYLLKRSATLIESGDYSDYEKLCRQCGEFQETISEVRDGQIERMRSSDENLTVSYVYLNILQETHEMASSLRHLLRAAYNFGQ